MLLLNILLCILKVIGIVILAVLGIVVLLLCLLLFVPIRYKVYASYFGRPKVSAHVTYLMKLLHIVFELDGEQSGLRIKIFGHNISGDKDKSGKRRKKAEDEGSRTGKPSKAANKTYDADKTTETNEGSEPEKGNYKADSLSSVNPEKSEANDEDKPAGQNKDGNPAVKNSQNDKKKDKGDKKSSGRDKQHNSDKNAGNVKITEKIKSIAALLRENRAVLAFVAEQIRLLFKHVMPGSHIVSLKLGLDDPALLGEILGGAAVLRAMTGLVINITPVWDEKIFEAEADLKGRIILGRVLFIAARVYFNKDVKKLIKIVKTMK